MCFAERHEEVPGAGGVLGFGLFNAIKNIFEVINSKSEGIHWSCFGERERGHS